MRRIAYFLSLILACAASSSFAAEMSYPRPELLIEPAEFAKSDVAASFVILDARPREKYDAGHIPGARWVDHETWKSAFVDGKDAEGWSRRIGQLGIGPENEVVIYDDAGSKDAARIWWIIRYWGHDHARLLNGGWAGWKSAKLPTTTELPAAVKDAEFRAQPRAERLATHAQVLDLIAKRSEQIIDSRSVGEFCGTQTLDNKRGGAMPGAKHLEWVDLIDKNTQRFKSPVELRKLFADAKVDLQAAATTHCQSGGRSSVMAFALELMGAKDVRNYYKGWSEWGNAADTPIVTPEPKS